MRIQVWHGSSMSILLSLILFVSALFPPPPEATWVWPTEGNKEVLRDFQAPLTPWGPGHRGLDLAATGDVLLAPVSGRISFSGTVVDRGVVTIATDNGFLVSMEPVTTELSAGTWVNKGDQIGTLDEGHCSQLCVHIGLRVDGRYRSPRLELGVGLRSVLLPWEA
jgi:murein DD-endopeptidase MepM/ murein hydrolase activator NlpD